MWLGQERALFFRQKGKGEALKVIYRDDTPLLLFNSPRATSTAQLFDMGSGQATTVPGTGELVAFNQGERPAFAVLERNAIHLPTSRERIALPPTFRPGETRLSVDSYDGKPQLIAVNPNGFSASTWIAERNEWETTALTVAADGLHIHAAKGKEPLKEVAVLPKPPNAEPGDALLFAQTSWYGLSKSRTPVIYLGLVGEKGKTELAVWSPRDPHQLSSLLTLPPGWVGGNFTPGPTPRLHINWGNEQISYHFRLSPPRAK